MAQREGVGSPRPTGSSAAAASSVIDSDSDDVDLVQVAPVAQKQPELISKGVSSLITGPDTNVGGCLAMDCEFVGVGFGGHTSALARCSIVNHHGYCVYDKFVKPTEVVRNYRTPVSGVRERDLQDATPFKEAQKEVSDLLSGRILVGHSVNYDLEALHLAHPWHLIRDTSQYAPFRRMNNGRAPSLKKLSQRVLGIGIQFGEHDSVVDAQATMKLYHINRQAWEMQY